MKTVRAALTACVLATLTAWPGAPHAQANRSAALPPDPATVIVTPAGAVGAPVAAPVGASTPAVASVASPTSIAVSDPGLLDQSLDYYAFIEGAPADPVLMAKDPNAGVSATLSLDGVHCGQNRIDVYYDYPVLEFRLSTMADRQTHYGFLFVACPTITLAPAVSYGAGSKTITVVNSGFDPNGDDQPKSLRFDGVQVASPTYSRLPRPITFTTEAGCGQHTVELSQPWEFGALDASAVHTVLCPTLALTPPTIMKSAEPAPVAAVGSQFAPNTDAVIKINGTQVGTGTTDPTGTLATTITADGLPCGAATVTMSQPGLPGPAPTASATLTVTCVPASVKVDPDAIQVGMTAHITGTGFTPAAPLTLTWTLPDGTSEPVNGGPPTAASDGTFDFYTVLLQQESLGPRTITATDKKQSASMPAVVEPSTMQPFGGAQFNGRR